MTRSILTLAAALFTATAFLASAAEACVSCSYVPPVVHTQVYSHHHSYDAERYERKRAYRAAKKRILKAKRWIEREPEEEVEPVETVKAAPAPAPAPTPAPVAEQVESENSSISTASVDNSETANAEATPATAASKNVGCKKFFPTVGMTLTVPCE